MELLIPLVGMLCVAAVGFELGAASARPRRPAMRFGVVDPESGRDLGCVVDRRANASRR